MGKVTDQIVGGARDGTRTIQIGNEVFSIGGWTSSPLESYNHIYKSSGDLSTWTFVENAPFDGCHTFGLVKDSAGYVYKIGGDTIHPNMSCWRSLDGVNWVKRADDIGIGYRVLAGYVYHNGAIYAMGGQTQASTDPATAYKDLWKSTDGGVTWTKIADNLNCVAGNICDAVWSYQGKIHVVSGGIYGTGIGRKEHWTIEDNSGTVTVTQLSVPPFDGRYYHEVLEFDGDLWMICGYNTNGNLRDIWHYNPIEGWRQWIGADSNFETRHATGACVYYNYKNQGIKALVLTNGNYWDDGWAITQV